jgi:hypothetical protein
MARFITRSSIAVDTTGPTAPTISASAGSSSTVTITRTVSATDSSGVASYETQRSLSGAGSWTTVDTSNTNPLTVSGLSASTAYDFRQRGIDTVGNLGTYSSTATATTSSSGTVFYQDSFEGFAPGANITGTAMNWVANNPGTIKASATFARTGSSSVLLPFGPPPRQTIELDFDLGADYREVTIEYYVRWPSNFQHTDSPSSDNNKFFRIYSNAGYNTQGKLGCSTELAARGNTQYADLASEWDNGDGNSFTARSGLSGTLAVACADFITPADFGTWTKVKWYVKAATARGTGRAILKLWKNDVLIIDEQPDIYTASEPMSFRYGYLFGARNTDDDTSAPNLDVYLDDMTVTVVA